MLTKIPQAKPSIGEEEIRAASDVLRSGMLASGAMVKRFEEAFAKYVGTKYGVAASNGTTALQVVFQALDLAAGRKRVLTTPFTFIATSNALRYNDLAPVYVDCEPDGFNMDPGAAIRAINATTGAVLPVHLYGEPIDVRELREICDKKGVVLVEDACQAHGARVDGRHVGSIGHVGCFSFYPTKNMTTMEGGMITTDDQELADRCRVIINQGQKSRYEHVMLGSNHRMTEVAAAIGLVQLAKLDRMVARRREIARRYDTELASVKGISLPRTRAGQDHSFHQYTLRTADRGALAARLERALVSYGVYYPKLSYEYSHLQAFASPCQIAEALTPRVISLPMYPDLSNGDVGRVIAAVKG